MSTPALLAPGSTCLRPVGSKAASGGRSRHPQCYMACVVLEEAPLIATFQEHGAAVNDRIAFPLPGKMHSAARKLKEDAPEEQTDSRKRVSGSMPTN